MTRPGTENIVLSEVQNTHRSNGTDDARAPHPPDSRLFSSQGDRGTFASPTLGRTPSTMVTMALESLSQAQHRLAASGFDDDLVADGSLLRSASTSTRHDPKTLKAVEIVRFEGDSDRRRSHSSRSRPAAAHRSAPIRRRTGGQPHLNRQKSSATSTVIATEDDTAEHRGHDHVAARFTDRTSAEAAIEALREVGLGANTWA